VLCGVALVGLIIIVPCVALTALRPLVPDMLDNLNSINRIGEGAALEDYEQIILSARGLMVRATAMQYLDLSAFGLDARRDPEWDAYLMAQLQGAAAIESAARKADARGVLEETQKLIGNSCLACHASFRDPSKLLRRSVFFMTSFLASWRDMNRGLVLRDFELVGQRAGEVEALSREMAADEVLEEGFGLGGTKQRRIFREFLLQITENSGQIEAAAREKDLATVLKSTRQMWTEGCIACHQEFRK
jgi:hypothetical protein